MAKVDSTIDAVLETRSATQPVSLLPSSTSTPPLDRPGLSGDAALHLKCTPINSYNLCKLSSEAPESVQPCCLACYWQLQSMHRLQ